MIQNGASIRNTASQSGIPRGTLQNRLHKRNNKPKRGPPTVLTEDEEKSIVKWILSNHRKGFPRRRLDLRSIVKNFMDASPRPNPFTNNLPGEKWLKQFFKRHPEITSRTPEPITEASSKVSESNIRSWFSKIKQHLIEENLIGIMDDPTRVFNGDETNFMMCPKSGKVLAPKGTNNIKKINK